MDLCEEKYIGGTDRTTMEDAAAAAIIEALGDRWSYYIPASEYQSYTEQMNNAYVGIGVTIALREDGTGLNVEAITPGGPAEEAGLQAIVKGNSIQSNSNRETSFKATSFIIAPFKKERPAAPCCQSLVSFLSLILYRLEVRLPFSRLRVSLVMSSA